MLPDALVMIYSSSSRQINAMDRFRLRFKLSYLTRPSS